MRKYVSHTKAELNNKKIQLFLSRIKRMKSFLKWETIIFIENFAAETPQQEETKSQQRVKKAWSWKIFAQAQDVVVWKISSHELKVHKSSHCKTNPLALKPAT